MAEFLKAREFLTPIEGGGLSDVQGDRGGRTYAGISEKNWPEWEGWKLIDEGENPPESMVDRFYYEQFWLYYKVLGEEWMPQYLANELFESSINCGWSNTTLWLQMGLNVMGMQWIRLDGIFGEQTLRTLLSLKGNNKALTFLHNMLNIQQGNHYIRLAYKDFSQQKFLAGWINKRVRLI